MPSSIKIFFGLGTIHTNSINPFTLVFTRAFFLSFPVSLILVYHDLVISIRMGQFQF